jgi:hypothetical protein
MKKIGTLFLIIGIVLFEVWYALEYFVPNIGEYGMAFLGVVYLFSVAARFLLYALVISGYLFVFTLIEKFRKNA